MVNIADDLDLRAAEVPERDGLIWEDGRRWTFRQLDEAASSIAESLERHGVTVGERVGLYLRNGPTFVTALFGAWKAGAVPVTMSSLYNAEELAGCVAKTEPVVVLTDGHGWDTASAMADGADLRVLGDEVAEAAPVLPAPEGGPSGVRQAPSMAHDAEAVVLFTGGTTGEPKAVSMTHGGVRDALAQLARASKGGKPGPYEMTPAEVAPNLVCLPLFHSGGQHAFLFAWFVGRTVVLMERFRVPVLDALVNEHGVDNLFLMPTMLYDLVHHDPTPDLTPVKSVLISGQALDPTLRARFEERFGIPILSNYGATEFGHVAGWTAKDLREGRWKPGAAGRVYDGVELEIRDEEGRALPEGEVGEICVRASLSSGYVDAGGSDGEQALVEDGWVHSGDIGYVDADGVLFLVGRKREMIKTGGFQVWPAELERALNEDPAVKEVAVLGVPHERFGEIPKAFVVVADDAEPGDDLAEHLIEVTRSKLAHFKAIREVEFVASLPRTEAGKIRRGDLAVSG